MKVTVNIECTPEEARTFLGLPDVRPLQEAMMAELETRMRGNLQAMSPENWLPTSLQSADQMQKMFWGNMQQMISNVVGGAAVTINDKAG